MTEHPAPQQTAPAPRRRRRAWKIAWAALAIVVAGLGALVGYGLSERGLPFIVARVVAQSGGRISVEGPSGSLAGTMRFRRIAWRGPDTTVIADDVVVEWNPRALWSSRLSIAGLGARHLAISIKPAPGATPPPTDLALPLAVSIARTAVAEIDWRVGSRSGHLTGLEFGYDGDAASHRIHDLRFASRVGTLSGSIALAARAPLAVDGRLAFTGTDALDGAKLALALGGTLPELDMKAKGTLRAATLSLVATVTPFAESAFANAQAELADVDAAAFDAALPQTLAHVRVDAHPDGDAIAGDIDVANGMPGPLDRGRFPVDGIKARYAFDGETLALDDMSTTVEGGANARGSIRIALATAPASARFTLAVRNVDLARIDTRLATTRLSGSVISDADSARQTVDAELTDRDLSLAFAAVVTASRVDLTRFRAQTGGGSLSGSAVLMRNDPGDFTLQATMHGLDPSRFAAMPKASIDASVKARGVLRPAWRADAELAVASGSRFDGLPLGGTAKATLSAQGLRDANVDLALASARLRAQGDLGRSGDRMTVALDAPKLADLSALLPAALPRPVAGGVNVEAALETGAAAASAAAITPTRSGQPSAVSTGPAAATTTVARLSRSLGGSVTLRASGLRAGSRYAVATLALRAAVAAPAGPSPVAWNERRLSLDVDATSIATSLRTLDSFHASAAGTLAQHHASIEAHGQDVDATATLDASLENVDHPALLAWRGTLASLANRGAVAFDLRGPASFSLSRDRVRLAGVRVEAAQGRADVDEFSWDAGRITTRGAFTGVTLAKAAALAGRPLPFDSTLVLGGDWSIDAAPRLNGRFTLHRERGDIYAGPAPDATLQSGSQRRSLGITALDVAGTLHDDVLDAQASFASTLAGRANATLHVGTSGSAEPGTIGADAPLALALRAKLASLAALQPWVGTSAAVDGRATLDIAARGSIAAPLWSGSIEGRDLRIDAPQYGVNLGDGRLRAHLAPAGIELDEASFAGGEGRFTATGTIALPAKSGEARTHVTWKAQRFRAANRPDLRLVLDGEGTILVENRKLALGGNVRIVEGHVEYEATPSGVLSPDIVVKGAPGRRNGAVSLRDLPLVLDVDVDFGPAMTFSGEGLDARLAGRVRITTAADGSLAGRGTIRAVNGTYYAFGQKLTIDRGELIFDGALDNPALDVVALRKNLAVEAGVQLTGTVKLPQVRVTSNPPVPENEALAWLVTGQAPSSSTATGTAGRTDYGALSAASAMLLSRGGKPLSAQVAQSVGLDEISLQSVGASGTSGTANQVVVLGKRISDRLTLGYEQGLSLATSALRLEYALSRSVTVRAEAGAISGVSIVYRRTFK